MGKHGKKDPKKVRAGRMGGKVSGGNFKHNREAAQLAGRKSAWNRGEQKLSDYPLGLLDEGREMAFPDHGAEKRTKRRARV